MSERAKNLELAKSTVDKLNKVWMKFPDFMQPDIKSFKAGLVIGDIPNKLPVPPFYQGLKPDYAENLRQAFDSFPMPESSYTDHETGKTYINDDLFNTSPKILEDFIAYQAGTFTFMQGHRVNGADFDQEESFLSDVYLKEICTNIPSQKDIYILRRGFERRLYFDDKTGQGKYIADLPPKGDLDNPDQYNLLNTIYPEAFSIITRTALNRNGDMSAVTKSIEEGKFIFGDFAGDNLNFSLRFFILSHFMDNNPWPLFDSLLNGDTKETERLFHDSLKEDHSGNLLQFLVDGLSVDEYYLQEFKMNMDVMNFVEDQVKKYWKAKLN